MLNVVGQSTNNNITGNLNGDVITALRSFAYFKIHGTNRQSFTKYGIITMTLNEQPGKMSIEAQQALTKLIASYRSKGDVEVIDAYDFIRLLSECANDSIESIIPLIYELAELDLKEVMRAAGNILMTNGAALPPSALPAQVLAITYFVIADSLSQEANGSQH